MSIYDCDTPKAKGLGKSVYLYHSFQYMVKSCSSTCTAATSYQPVAATSVFFSASFSACDSRRPFSCFSLRSLYLSTRNAEWSRSNIENLYSSSATSTTRSRKLPACATMQDLSHGPMVLMIS